jgi:hypothetical protein
VTRTRTAEFLTWSLLVTVLELLFVSSVDLPEFVAAVALGLVTGAGATAARAATGNTFRPSVGWLAWLAPLPAAVVRDTFAVFRAAASGETGGWRTIETPGAGDDARASARRALMVLTMSTAPASFLVDVDPRSGRGLVHDFGAAASPSALERAVTS